MSLTNLDMTDRELLLAVGSTTNGDGYVTSDEIADVLGVPPRGKISRATRVAPRLSYMVRKGFLMLLDPTDFGKAKKERLYAITEFGAEIMRGRLTATLERAIDSASAGSSVVMMSTLARRSYIEASDELATAVRRQFQHDIARRH